MRSALVNVNRFNEKDPFPDGFELVLINPFIGKRVFIDSPVKPPTAFYLWRVDG
jgi:hypothetical protein